MDKFPMSEWCSKTKILFTHTEKYGLILSILRGFLTKNWISILTNYGFWEVFFKDFRRMKKETRIKNQESRIKKKDKRQERCKQFFTFKIWKGFLFCLSFYQLEYLFLLGKIWWVLGDICQYSFHIKKNEVLSRII